jgi:hypothetical protein
MYGLIRAAKIIAPIVCLFIPFPLQIPIVYLGHSKSCYCYSKSYYRGLPKKMSMLLPNLNLMVLMELL